MSSKLLFCIRYKTCRKVYKVKKGLTVYKLMNETKYFLSGGLPQNGN